MSSLALALGSLCLIIVVEQMRRVNNSDLAVASWNVFCAQSGRERLTCGPNYPHSALGLYLMLSSSHYTRPTPVFSKQRVSLQSVNALNLPTTASHPFISIITSLQTSIREGPVYIMPSTKQHHHN